MLERAGGTKKKKGCGGGSMMPDLSVSHKTLLTLSLFSPPSCSLSLSLSRARVHTKLSIFTALALGLAGWIVLQGKTASTSFRSDNIHGIHREQEASH